MFWVFFFPELCTDEWRKDKTVSSFMSDTEPCVLDYSVGNLLISPVTQCKVVHLLKLTEILHTLYYIQLFLCFTAFCFGFATFWIQTLYSTQYVLRFIFVFTIYCYIIIDKVTEQ